ncbi:uncharacterized protein [Periplaneta americana]|uniref:uncharacterized protein isoform X2 n=1 Tax=Periplaneta americana TaxID=6978 RepID=UPI0037E7F73A
MSNKRLCSSVIEIAALVLCSLHCCEAACYFPIELQGEYVMQSTSVTPGGQVQYSQVNITAEAIPIWGHCHRRLGSSVILTDSSGGANCSRCFHIELRSRNVLQVRTEGLDKCYTNQDAAEATCPNEKTLQQGDHFKDIILYKTKDLGGENITQVYCPINGRFNFIYNVNDGSESKTECPDPVSELDNCPSGSALNLRFQRCSFDNRDVTFQCLGHWSGPADQRYLALRDTRPGWNRLPPYRCALYREEIGTGNVYMAFSSDSTCSTNLRSATAGYETLNLNVMPAQVWPPQVDTSNCRFPQWSHGYWQHMYIEGNTLTYKDHSTFKTYTIRCLGGDTGIGERFFVFARTQCGEEMYTCIWLKRRGVNVLEFQLGLQSSTYFNDTLCSDSNFVPKLWITQGRLERLQESPCPVAGEYTGVIPDATNLCAKLSSDCRYPEIMYYTVSDCSQPEIYEGSRRRGRKRRQSGTRIYRISNPRTSTTSPTPLTLIPSNDTILFQKNVRNISSLQNGEPLSQVDAVERGTYSAILDDQQPQYTSEAVYSRSNHPHYSSAGPRYPTSYQIGTSTTTFRPVTSWSEIPEEEYDPWTFSKTHGQHADNHSDGDTSGPIYDPHHYDRNRNSDYYHRTSARPTEQTGSNSFHPQSTGKQDEMYSSRSDWNHNPNRHGTSENEQHQGSNRNTYNNDKIYRNEDPQINQRPSGIPNGHYRGTEVSYKEHAYGTQRPIGGYSDSNSRQGFPYSGNSQMTPGGINSNHHGSNRDWNLSYNGNSPPVTHRTVGNYPGSNRDNGFSYNENPQRTTSGYPGPNRNNDQRRTEGYIGANRDQTFSIGTNRDHGFTHNENSRGTQRNDRYPGSYRDLGPVPTEHSTPSVFSSQGEPGIQRDYRTSTENYMKHGVPPEIHESYGSVRNTGIHTLDTRDQNHHTLSPNPRKEEKLYSTPSVETRIRDRYHETSTSGRFNGQNPNNTPHWVSTNPPRVERPSRPQWNGNVDARTVSHPVPHSDWEGPWSSQNRSPIPVSHPAHLPPLQVQRPRHGDRPIAVPRTAAPSKREERQYRCLGQWEEDGRMYTYTQRRDVGTYECFVGSIISNDEIYIKEAGDHCQRNIDPMHFGMKLTRKAPPRDASGGGERNTASALKYALMAVLLYVCQH